MEITNILLFGILCILLWRSIKSDKKPVIKLTAQQAKAKSDEIRSDEFQANKVKSFIAKTAETGQYQLIVTRLTTDGIKTILEKDGFKITESEQNQGSEESPKMVPISIIVWGQEPKMEVVK